MVDASNALSDGKLLLATEPDPVMVLNRDSPGPFLFTCDHASNRMPTLLGNLGMSAEQLSSHIAWDPGALAVAQQLATQFQSPLVFSSYSRLVVDLNRPPESPDSIPAGSAGIPIPGNIGLSDAARQSRLLTLFQPYHETIDQLLGERLAARRATALVAIHSFTPDYPGEVRPWHVGVIHRHDRDLGAALVAALRKHDDILVGDNLPFQIRDDGDATIPRHGEQRRLPNALIELRQDTLTTASDRDTWTRRLHTALQAAMAGQTDR